MDTTTSKILALCVLLVETCICGLVPLWLINVLKRYETRFTRLLELANLFAGGVFLATLLLHLAPEATETLENALEDSGIHVDYPVAEILVASGFFLIAVVEQIAFCFHHSAPQDCQDPSQQDSVHIVHSHSKDRAPNHHVDETYNETSPLLKSNEIAQKPSGSQKIVENSCSHALPVMASETHDHIVTATAATKTITIRSLIFFLALSLHSLFEGMAIGLQNEVTDVLETLLAVGIHKGVIAFSFTFSMTEQGIKSSIIVFYIIALAIVSPVGVGIGIIVSETSTGTSADLVNGVLQSIAAGTFLFVVFFEILPRELHCHNRLQGTMNLLFTLVGFGLMAGLQAIGEHDHSHGHSHDHPTDQP